MRFMFVLLTSLCLWPSVLIAEDPPSQIGKFFLPAKEAASKVTTTTRVAIVEIRGEMQRTSTELGAGYQMHYTGGPSPNYGSPGAEITMLVKGASWLGYRFNPEPPLPLVFKLVADKGLVYLSGTGEVTDSAGKSYQFGEDMRVDRCIRGLQSTDPLIREGAAQALGYLGDASAASALIAAFGDSSPSVQRNAIEAVGKLKAPEALAPLKQGKWSGALKPLVDEATGRIEAKK